MDERILKGSEDFENLRVEPRIKIISAKPALMAGRPFCCGGDMGRVFNTRIPVDEEEKWLSLGCADNALPPYMVPLIHSITSSELCNFEALCNRQISGWFISFSDRGRIFGAEVSEI